ncbi:hypothetical protein [Oceanobacillus sp. 1P07AA]|uniref:hypothetical protein n=1 Tax=Oceanobacillus sp. 1P07AA TaxID=3132293 RepID=UPI0039A45C9B
MKKSIVATILLGLIVVLAACGGGNTDSDSDGNTEINNSTGETESTSSSEDFTLNNDIEIKAKTFNLTRLNTL